MKFHPSNLSPLEELIEKRRPELLLEELGLFQGGNSTDAAIRTAQIRMISLCLVFIRSFYWKALQYSTTIPFGWSYCQRQFLAFKVSKQLKTYKFVNER
jgi:hypothetical protein